MDSFELNKIIGALLGAVFVIFSVSLLSEAIFSSPAPETAGYAIDVPEDEGHGGGEEPAEPESILPLLASADPSKGEAIFKRCASCHTDDQSGANKVGPNLWGVVERPVASHEGFSYSGAMQEFSEGGSVTWTYENLDHFLANPKGLVSGTAMAFAGLKSIEDRANVIAYLREKADSPVPLPEPAAEGGDDAEAAAPAEGEAEEAAPAEGGAEQAEPAADEGAAEPEAGSDAEADAPAETDAGTGTGGDAGAPDAQAPAADEQPQEGAAEEAAPAETETGTSGN